MQRAAMRSLCVMLYCCILSIHSGYSEDIRVPPSITQQPTADSVVRRGNRVELECGVNGKPKPSIGWNKNGQDLDMNNANLEKNHDFSKIAIKEFGNIDDGYYQCTAYNQHGKTLSNVIRIQISKLESIQDATKKLYYAQEGERLVINYKPVVSVPKPVITWAITPSETDKDSGRPLTLSRRIQTDNNGNLYFANVKISDNQNGQVYKANAFNPILDFTAGGSYASVVVNSGSAQLSGPTLAFSSPSPVIGLEGQSMSLRCFFYSNPEATISWEKSSGSLPQGRYELMNHNSELNISRIVPEDEGDYLCKGINSQNQNEHNIRVKIEAIPVFKNPSDGPHNINVTEGQTVTISCDAYAKPAADVKWFINGQPINSNQLEPKYRFGNNGKQLIIDNVCKSCDKNVIGRETDLVVIQCNASNTHGHIFSSGYVNVLKKTTIKVRPENMIVKASVDTSAHFTCSFNNDPSTPASITWFKVTNNGEKRLYNIPDEIILDDDGSLEIRVRKNNTKRWNDYVGTYKCLAKSEYSEDVAEVWLALDKPPEPLKGGIADFWWIFIIIAVILIFVILICCCCLYRQRNKGDSYPVDEKEHENGNDPEKELLDSGFQDYQRLDSKPLQGSKASLASSAHLHSDDDSGLVDYSKIDTEPRYAGYNA